MGHPGRDPFGETRPPLAPDEIVRRLADCYNERLDQLVVELILGVRRKGLDRFPTFADHRQKWRTQYHDLAPHPRPQGGTENHGTKVHALHRPVG